jgi:hypothetical protein
MFWSQKRSIASADLAEALLEEFIYRTTFDASTSLRLDAPSVARFADKAHLYKLASVLIALGREEQTNSRFAAVRAEFERRVFPPTQEEGAGLLVAIKFAMKDLSTLLFLRDNPKEMSWARHWLLDIGVDETNPSRLFLFAIYWMDFHIMTSKALQSFKPM